MYIKSSSLKFSKWFVHVFLIYWKLIGLRLILSALNEWLPYDINTIEHIIRIIYITIAEIIEIYTTHQPMILIKLLDPNVLKLTVKVYNKAIP